MSQYQKTLGTVFIGAFFNTLLYGVVCKQCISYYNSRQSDSIPEKTGVTILFLNDTFQSGTMVYLAWLYCVENYSNPAVVLTVRWPYIYIPIGTVLTTTVTHLFMTHRIYIMSRRRFLVGLLIVGIVGSAVTGIILGIKAWQLSDFFIKEHDKLKPFLSCWLGMQVVLDAFIAVFSIFWLHRQRDGPCSKTISVVDRLIRSSFQAGIVSLFFTLAGLISFVVQPDSNLFVAFVIPMGRTYTTVFLNGLIVRENLNQRLGGVTDLSVDMRRRTPRIPSGPIPLNVLSTSVPGSPTKTDHTFVFGPIETASAESQQPFGDYLGL